MCLGGLDNIVDSTGRELDATLVGDDDLCRVVVPDEKVLLVNCSCRVNQLNQVGPQDTLRYELRVPVPNPEEVCLHEVQRKRVVVVYDDQGHVAKGLCGESIVDFDDVRIVDQTPLLDGLEKPARGDGHVLKPSHAIHPAVNVGHALENSRRVSESLVGLVEVLVDGIQAVVGPDMQR